MSGTAHRQTTHIVEQAPDTLNTTDELQRPAPKCEKPDTRARLTHDSIQRKCSRYFAVVFFFFFKGSSTVARSQCRKRKRITEGKKNLCRVTATLCILAAVRASSV